MNFNIFNSEVANIYISSASSLLLKKCDFCFIGMYPSHVCKFFNNAGSLPGHTAVNCDALMEIMEILVVAAASNETFFRPRHPWAVIEF